MTQPNPATITAEAFCEVLESQRSSYERLGELAREQSEFIREGDTEQLLTILQRRQLYVERIQEQEGQLQEVKRDWPGSTAAWPGDLRRRAEAAFGEIKILLEKITACDRQDMQTLQAHQMDVSRQLQRSAADERTTRRINQSYAASAYGGTRATRMDLIR